MGMKGGRPIQAHVLIKGSGQGEALVLAEPLSLWGGLNPETGEIIDRRHPDSGSHVSGKVLLLPVGRGSSSASSILLEAVRTGKAPAAIITREPDPILALGAAVARELYGFALPILVLEPADYAQIVTGSWVSIDDRGRVTLEKPAAIGAPGAEAA
jgi:predicted aconitase with swiveling domain